MGSFVNGWSEYLLVLKILVPKALWHAMQTPFKSYTVEYLRHFCLSHLTFVSYARYMVFPRCAREAQTAALLLSPFPGTGTLPRAREILFRSSPST